MLDAHESLLCSKLCQHNVDNPTDRDKVEIFERSYKIFEEWMKILYIQYKILIDPNADLQRSCKVFHQGRLFMGIKGFRI